METQLSQTRRGPEAMFTLIQSFKDSGLSQYSFCKEHNLSYSVFQYWLKKFKKEADQNLSSGFVELKASSKTFSKEVEIIFPSGIKVVLSGKHDPDFIRSLVL